MKNWLTIGVAAVLAILLFIFIQQDNELSIDRSPTPMLTRTGTPSPTPTPELTITLIPTPTESPDDYINFLRRGELSMNESEQKADAWYLIYDIPGQQDLSAELVFAVDSKCIINNTDTSCETGLDEGIRVMVEGHFEDNTIQVTRLETIK